MLKLSKFASALPSACAASQMQLQVPKKLACVQFSSKVFAPNCGVPLEMKLRKTAEMGGLGGQSQRTYMNMTSKSKKKTSERKMEIEGVNLNIKEEGEGSQIILCLPGLIGTIGTDFGAIFSESNKSKFRLVSWDPPGHGKSRPPDREHTTDYYIKDAHLVAKLMETLGHEKYSILGWGNGGITGYSLAADFPDNVTHLVIWGTHGFFDEKVVATGLGASDSKNWPKSLLKTMTDIYGKDYLEKMLADWADSVKELVRTGEGKRLTNRIPLVKCPSLVIHGQKDSVVGIEHAQYLADNFKNSTLNLMYGGDHSLHLSRTEEFLNLVEPFLLNKNK